MLRESCHNCNVPFLKNKKGDVFCGSCETRPGISDNKNQDKYNNQLENLESKKIINSAETILYGKLEQITNQIASKNVNEIKNDLELMELILKMIQKISKFGDDIS